MRHIPSGKVSIKDIAEMCSVSTQTVSRVINKRPDVSPTTRHAVEEAIARVGYRPSALARMLVQQRSTTFGFVTTGLMYVGIAQTLNGIAEQCQTTGYGLLVKDLPETAGAELLNVIDFFIARHVEGIIVLVPGFDVGAYLDDALIPPSCPPMVFLKSVPDPRFSTIAVDNAGGARMATEHLLGLGRTRVAHISGPLDWLESRQRQDGWAATLAAAGLPNGHLAGAEGDWSSQSGAAALEHLLDSSPGLDAVFAANDQMALGAMSVCHRRGLRIPDDVAIVGFDGVSEAEQFTPSLSTIRQPLREMGVAAVAELLAQVNDADRLLPVLHVVLDVELIVRESTAGRPG